MHKQLKVSLGQYTDAGAKPLNQDAVGACIPQEPLLTYKGIALAVADGISSSVVSQVASDTAVTCFLTDYYATSEAWSVKTAAAKVLQATNAWLHSQTYNSPYRYNKDKGYICTFSALIIKSNRAHIIHTGDSRVYQVHADGLEPLTEDHRRYHSADSSYLTRALGIHRHLELDYRQRQVAAGDVFLLASDGVYEFIRGEDVGRELARNSDLNAAASALARLALTRGSQDNLSVQLLRIEQLPGAAVGRVTAAVNPSATSPQTAGAD